MLALVLDLLLGRKCDICRSRVHDLISHEVYAHTPTEWQQHSEMRRRR